MFFLVVDINLGTLKRFCYTYIMTKHIFVTREIPEHGLALLRAQGYQVDVNPKNVILTPKQLIGFLKKKPYDAVLSLLTDKIDAAIFDAAPSAKIFANYATGFDNIDRAEAKKRGITVTNAPADLASQAVAEHVLALMLSLTRRVVEADRFVRAGKYDGWSAMNMIGMDIAGKTLGLIGAGAIGHRVAFYAKGLGMNVIYYDVKRNELRRTSWCSFLSDN